MTTQEERFFFDPQFYRSDLKRHPMEIREAGWRMSRKTLAPGYGILGVVVAAAYIGYRGVLGFIEGLTAKRS